MDRYNKLKLLKEETAQLFYNGVNENKAYNRLCANSYFGSIVRRTDIHSFYKYLQKKAGFKLKYEFHVRALEDEEKLTMAKFECITEHHENSSKFWLYDEITHNAGRVMDTWQSRFLMIEQVKNNMCNVEVLDMFQNISKSFDVQGVIGLYKIYSLSFPFVLFHRIQHGIEYFSLVRFDFANNSLHEVQSFEREKDYFVFVDQFDSSKFILKGSRDEMHICELLNGQLKIGDKINIQWESNGFCTSYFNNQLYSLKFGRGDEFVKILVYNLEQKKSAVFQLEKFPENLSFVDLEEYMLSCCKWVRDHFFTVIQFCLTGEYGIAYAEPNTCKWTIVEFVVKIPINHMKFVDGQNLMIYAKETGSSCEREVYKISMQKPDSLRNMAWIKLIKKLKNENADDPYKKAREYLPLNSEIQPFVFIQD